MSTSSNNGQQTPPRVPGRPSAKVLRRRRQVAGGIALLVVAVLIFGGVKLVGFIGGLGSSSSNDAGAATAPTVSSSAGVSSAIASASVQPDATKATKDVCDEAGIKVTASADKESYAAGVDPKLTLRVSNTGTVACSVNVGTSQMEFKITSGTDTIFNSKDCQVDASNLAKTLNPGASETANFTWKRNRSVAGCTKVNTVPGTGTYVYVATLGKWSSEKVVFALK